jgi:hypothetical protein
MSGRLIIGDSDSPAGFTNKATSVVKRRGDAWIGFTFLAWCYVGSVLNNRLGLIDLDETYSAMSLFSDGLYHEGREIHVSGQDFRLYLSNNQTRPYPTNT